MIMMMSVCARTTNRGSLKLEILLCLKCKPESLFHTATTTFITITTTADNTAAAAAITAIIRFF